jgi:hypothetical protein
MLDEPQDIADLEAEIEVLRDEIGLASSQSSRSW